jgi:hypothetical protein
MWYPDELAGIDVVEFDGRSYVCEVAGSRCVQYESGPPPLSFLQPDIWCESACTYYDPDIWFELEYELRLFFCRDALFGYQQHDCVAAVGKEPPRMFLEPDIYCSGAESFPRCSDLWYPDELDQHELADIGGTTYLCERAITGGFGDFDCGRYEGGDPTRVYTGELKCTESFGSFECDTDFYPSELEGVFFVSIDFQDYACKETFRGSECFRYFGGSIRSAMLGLPDFYCDTSGQCSDEYYP